MPSCVKLRAQHGGFALGLPFSNPKVDQRLYLDRTTHQKVGLHQFHTFGLQNLEVVVSEPDRGGGGGTQGSSTDFIKKELGIPILKVEAFVGHDYVLWAVHFLFSLVGPGQGKIPGASSSSRKNI